RVGITTLSLGGVTALRRIGGWRRRSAPGRLPPVSQDPCMAAFDFSAAQATASMAEGQHASVPIQSLLVQINADAVCLVRTQFQQHLHQPRRSAWIHPFGQTRAVTVLQCMPLTIGRVRSELAEWPRFYVAKLLIVWCC